FLFYLLILIVIGKVKSERTGIPSSIAGFHLGIDFITLITSLLNVGSLDSLILILVRLPSFSTTKVAIILISDAFFLSFKYLSTFTFLTKFIIKRSIPCSGSVTWLLLVLIG